MSELLDMLNKLPHDQESWEPWVALVKAALIAEHRIYYAGEPVTTCSDFIFCEDDRQARAQIVRQLEEAAESLGAKVIRSWPQVFEQAYATLHRSLQRASDHEVIARKALWIVSEDEAPSLPRFERTWCAVNWPAHHAGDGVVPSICGGPVSAYWPEITSATVIFARIARRETARRLLKRGLRINPALERRQAVLLKGKG